MNWQHLELRWGGLGRHRLRTHLAGLVLATLVPTLLAGAFALWRTSESHREASASRLADMARTLAHAIERDLGSKAALVQTLAAPAGGAGGAAGLQTWLDGAGLLPGAVVVSETADALRSVPPFRLHTPAGLPLDAALGVMADGRVAVTNLFADPPRVAIVTRHGSSGRTGDPTLLAVVVAPEQLVHLAPQDGADGDSLLVAVTDGHGRVVARSRDGTRFAGRRVPDWDKVRLDPADHGLFEAVSTEGQRVTFAFQRLRGTPGWVVVAGEPVDTFNAGWLQLQKQLLLGGAVAVAFALLLAAGMARRVLRPVAHLARVAQAAAEGDRPPDLPAAAPGPAIVEFELLRQRIDDAHAALHQRAEDARRHAEALAVSERRYRSLAEAGALVLWRATVEGRLIAATGWASLTGQPEHEALGLGWLARIHGDDRRRVTAALLDAAAGARAVDLEFRLGVAAGGWRWMRVRGVLVAEPGRAVAEWAGALEDVDERRRAEAHVVHLARHDPLTQLPNRTRFREGLLAGLAQVTPDAGAAVLCVDLDGFKAVNDTLGHPAGDALLLAVTQRLTHVVREGDTVARMGGDEFAIVQTGLTSPRDAELLASRIVSALGTPFELEGQPVHIGASVGIAHAVGPDADPDRLMARADLALYDAKQGGRGCHRTFTPAMEAQAQARRQTERALAEALEQGQLEVLYEPVVNVRFGTVCGHEARLHWRHPVRGLVAFDDVADAVDAPSLVRSARDGLLRLACRDAAGWPDGMRVAVDVSSAQLRDPAFPGTVALALQHAGLAAGRLELEVDERLLTQADGAPFETLYALKALGVRLVIDHFGSDRSALGCLGRFPFDKVKIEERFVQRLGAEREGTAIVRALTALCDTLGIASGASGVAAAGQLQLLSGEECVEAQGPLFGGARPSSEVSAAGTRAAPPVPGPVDKAG